MNSEDFNTGIDVDQLVQEAEASLRIQDKRIGQGDELMRLTVNRSAQIGDIESMTPEQREALFNPDGLLADSEVYERMNRYITEHNKTAFGADELRPKVAGVGQDSTGRYRMPNPGERVTNGLIEMVDPRYADEVAQKMRDIEGIDAKNSMQRSSLMNETYQLLTNRVSDPIGAIHVSFDESRRLSDQYNQERLAGWPQSRHDFLPLPVYMQSLAPRARPNGTIAPALREILANECGVFQMGTQPDSKLKGKIVCVRDKDFTQNLNIQVAAPTTKYEARPMVPTQNPTPNPSQVTVRRGPSPLQVQANPPKDPMTELIASLPPPPPGFRSST